MISRSLLAICCTLALTSCEKKPAAADPSISPAVSNVPPEPAGLPTPRPAQTPPAEPIAAPADNNYAPVLGQLTQALRKYYFERRQVPKSFEEFVATGAVQAPAPPAGKKFAIDHKRLEVILVNR